MQADIDFWSGILDSLEAELAREASVWASIPQETKNAVAAKIAEARAKLDEAQDLLDNNDLDGARGKIRDAVALIAEALAMAAAGLGG